MVLAGHQLRRTFPDALGPLTAQEAPVVQEELEQGQIRAAQLTVQREVVAKSRVEILDQRA